MWIHPKILVLVTAATLFGCTKTVPSQFKLLPAEDAVQAGFEVTGELVTKSTSPVDILWVVDNSASMTPSQDKLRAGLGSFASKYLRAGTDIQLAVITTDAFVANVEWQKYLNTPIGSANKTPIQYRKSDDPSRPVFGPDYAKLKSGDLMKTKGASISALTSKFKKEVSVGTKGIYEERGFGSVSQFLADNEKDGSSARLFRPGSQRIIVFLSDENDQTIEFANMGAGPHKLLYRGSYYKSMPGQGDPAVANQLLPAHFTIDCKPSKVDGKDLGPMSLCARPELLQSPEAFKAELDAFFTKLDGSAPNASPNYMVAAIVGMNYETIKGLRETPLPNGKPQGEVTHERGDRYIRLTEVAGGRSFAMDIGAKDYTPILEKIGLEIVERSVTKEFKPITTFELVRAPVKGERIEVTRLSASGDKQVLSSDQFVIVGNRVEISDEQLKKALKPGDRIVVRYQPATVKPANQT